MTEPTRAEILCPECKGTGISHSEYCHMANDHVNFMCERCEGFGKVDSPITKPTRAEAKEAFERLLRTFDEHCQTYYIETLREDYGEDDEVFQDIKTIRAALEAAEGEK